MLGRQAFGYRWHWMTISKRFIIERLAGTHGAGRTYEAIGKLSKGDCAFGVGEIKLKIRQSQLKRYDSKTIRQDLPSMYLTDD
jgi:hypothetical protein